MATNKIKTKSLSEREMLEFIVDKVSDLSTDVGELKSDVSILKSDVSTLQIQMTNVRIDVAELKDDMKVVKDTLIEHTGMLVEMSADIKRLDEERLMMVNRPPFALGYGVAQQDRLEQNLFSK